MWSLEKLTIFYMINNMQHYLTNLSLSILIILFSNNIWGNNTIQHTKAWATTVVTGTLIQDSPFRYYLEPQIRFIDNHYKFEEALLYVGIGYEFSPYLTLFVGDAGTISRQSSGDYVRQNRIWQQLNWNIFCKNKINVISRTRLEERKNLSEAQWAVRLRERWLLRIGFPYWQNRSIVLFDEIFFNFNHPAWAGNSGTISQNRAFVGIGTQFSKQATVDVGYLNQYQFTVPNQVSHVLLVIVSLALT